MALNMFTVVGQLPESAQVWWWIAAVVIILGVISLGVLAFLVVTKYLRTPRRCPHCGREIELF